VRDYENWNNDPFSHPIYKTWISLTNKEAAGSYSGLTPAERVFYNVYLLDLEVYNGGFLRYFGNTEGEHADDLVGSLAAIGADETAARVERFLSQVFPWGVPTEAVARRDLALRVEDDYDQFRSDEEALTDWYCKEKDAIFDRLQWYAREHGFLVE
jgi:hypothetical protein